MKFLVVISSLLAVAAAFPSESRAKRGVYDFGGFGGHGAYAGYAGHGGFGGLGGLGAVVKGPSGVINTGAFGVGHVAPHAVVSAPASAAAVVAAPAPAAAVVAAAAPAHGYAGASHHHGPASVSSAPQVAGVINSPSATLIGPSTDGHPGAVIPKGHTAVYGYGVGAHGGYAGAGFHGGAGYHGGYWG
ncbi:hypothetical protein RUM43_011683 [Polyplax serrata]|uniref:Uncharacterized protein n=1 Tax=Polyplax serrata TaxID=468196 RepID=A0AAN8S187_POLSC